MFSGEFAKFSPISNAYDQLQIAVQDDKLKWPGGTTVECLGNGIGGITAALESQYAQITWLGDMDQVFLVVVIFKYFSCVCRLCTARHACCLWFITFRFQLVLSKISRYLYMLRDM